MKLQSAPVFSPEDYPDVPEPLLKRLTETCDELYAALARVPERAEAMDRTFTTNDLGSAYVDLKTSGKVTHLLVTRSPTPDGGENDRLWGYSWRNISGGAARILFVGLSPTTKYSFSAEIR